MTSEQKARSLALLTPLVLLGGAYISQYGFGLFPCEMCWWQRYAHFAAVPLAALAFAAPRQGRAFVALAGLAIAVSAAIGGFHAGVEYHWWQGFTECTSYAAKGGDPLDAIMNAPLIRCDAAQWTFLGISLAGFNFIFSGAAALVIFAMLARKMR
ncbi:MAG: disulfide bond formation protein B [Novosphingobium sp.]